MINYQKKVLLEKVGEPTFIRHNATDTHNEVTVAIVTYEFNLDAVLPAGTFDFSPAVLEALFKALNGFQDINLEFNYDHFNPALTFNMKAKTERRGDDTHDQALADKIVLSRADVKACVVAKRLTNGIINYCNNMVKSITPITQLFEKYAERETVYIGRLAKPIVD